MATIQCPNPQCKTKSSVPDTHLGKKVRCKICNTPFVASAVPGEAVTTRPAQGAGPGPKLRTVTATVPAPPAVPVAVTVRRVAGAPAGGSAFWCLAALLAFVVPITAASTFAILNWKNDRSADAGEGNDSAERFGAIEIGSKGVKFTVFEVFPDEQLGHDYRILADGSSDTNIVTPMKETGTFDEQGLTKTAGVAGKFMQQLQKEHDLPSERVVIVGSGGLFGALDGRPEAERARLVAQNKKNLREAVGKVIPGRGVYFVDVEEELQYQLRACVPSRHRDSAIFIDVGGGGTRGGYQDSVGVLYTFNLPGIKSFGKQIKAKREGEEPLPEAAARLAPRELREPLQRHIERTPGLRSRDRVYLGGGVVWVLATCQHPADRKGSYVRLSVKDIDAFAARLRQNPDFLKTFSPPADLDEEKRKEVAKEVAKMRGIFAPEELVAGAEILRALVAELELGRKEELAFYRYSNNAWLLSFVAEKSGFPN